LATGRGPAAVAVVDRTVGHDGVAEARVVEERQVAAEVRAGEIRVKEARLAPGTAVEARPAEARALQTRLGENGAVVVGRGEVRAAPVNAAQRRAVVVLAHKGAPGEIALRSSAAWLGSRAGPVPAAVGAGRLATVVAAALFLVLFPPPLAAPLGLETLVRLGSLPIASLARAPLSGSGVGDLAAERHAEEGGEHVAPSARGTQYAGEVIETGRIHG
jgi:hypothetical protein